MCQPSEGAVGEREQTARCESAGISDGGGDQHGLSAAMPCGMEIGVCGAPRLGIWPACSGLWLLAVDGTLVQPNFLARALRPFSKGLKSPVPRPLLSAAWSPIKGEGL